MVLGSIFGILIIAGVIGFVILAVKGNALDAESKAYVDRVTPALLTNLNKETLFTYASDELKASASPAEFDGAFAVFAKLGKLKEYKGSKGEATMSISSERGKQITGVYQAFAEFEQGPATIKISVIKKGDRWQILGFFINSAALVKE